MASKAMTNEAYLEEYNKLDLELKQLQHELADTVELNDELTKVIAQKEDELYNKDKRLDSLKERNLADGNQLDLELTTLTEKISFEITTKEELVQKLEIQYKRFTEIQRENEGLRESVNMLQSLMEKNRDEHAILMHEKNVEMKQLREDMEKKMREQLNKMDISYQKDAFAALSERHKKAMFQNAKLKDEVALQGVGLNNLGSRLAKQNQQFDICTKELKALNKKLRVLKERLSLIAAKKIEIARKKEEVLADEQVLSQTKDDLRNKLEADPQLPDCVQHREQLHIVILNTKCDIQMWAQRLARLQELNLNLKPVYEHEQLQGRFNPQAFPLEASMSLHTSVSAGRMSSKMSSGMSLGSGGSRSPSPTNRTPVARTTPTLTPSRSKASARNTGGFPSPTSSAYVPGHPHGQGQSQSQVVVPLALRPADLEELFERDPTLAVALSSLRGKESTILATLPDEAQNKAKAAAAAGGGGGGGKGGGVPPKADAFQKNSVAERDQNMTAWVTLKIVDVWESTRQENERRKAEKHRLLDQILVAMHTDGMMASFMENSTLPDQSNNNSFLGSAAAVMRSERNSISPFSPTICSNNPQVGQELLDVIQEIASLDEGEREVVQEGDAPPTAAAPAAEEESGSEIESLLSAGAEQLAVLPAVRTTGARNPRASHIPALFIEEHPEQVAASPDPLTGGVASTGMSRLEERNWIENGELDEEMIHDLWDEAFSSVQSDSMFGTVHRHEGNQHNSLTAWLKPVPEAKRHPTSNAHLEGMSPKKPPAAKKRTPQKGNTSPQAGDYTTEATATGTALPRNLTAALLCEPVKYEDASSKFFVAPPVSLERAREGMGMGTAEEARRRSLTLPAIGSAARNKGTAAAPSRDFGAQLGVNKDTSGLEVTEEGLVLRDPLMGKKFAQQRKAIVAQAMKASAALKRSASASEGVQKSATMSALSQSSEILPSSMPKKKNVHALSSSAVALKSAI